MYSCIFSTSNKLNIVPFHVILSTISSHYNILYFIYSAINILLVKSHFSSRFLSRRAQRASRKCRTRLWKLRCSFTQLQQQSEILVSWRGFRHYKVVILLIPARYISCPRRRVVEWPAFSKMTSNGENCNVPPHAISRAIKFTARR